MGGGSMRGAAALRMAAGGLVAQGGGAAAAGQRVTAFLQLENLARLKELENEQNYIDIIADVEDECSRHGMVENVSSNVPSNVPSNAQSNAPSNAPGTAWWRRC